MRFVLFAASALFAAMPAAAAAPVWTILPAASKIAFSGVHAGNPFTGTFGQWTGTIRFDPADLPHSSATIVIGTGSAKTGDSFQETSLAQDEWFDPTHFPRATFATVRISAAGPGRYVADGVLTIKGKALPVKLPFTIKIAGATATMAASTTVDRIAFGIGAKADPTAQWVTRPIGLAINLTAHRQ